MNSKKKYTKPCVASINKGINVVPLAELAVGAALAGGYLVGRVAKSVDARMTNPNNLYLRKVIKGV